MSHSDTIKKAIRKKLPAVKCTDNIKTAIQAMTDADASAVVVFNGSDLVGILTDVDLMTSIANHQDINSQEVSTAMTACELITGKAASSPCVQLDEDQTVESAIGVMNEAGVHHLLVSGNSGQAVGVVSAKDLLRVVIS